MALIPAGPSFLLFVVLSGRVSLGTASSEGSAEDSESEQQWQQTLLPVPKRCSVGYFYSTSGRCLPCNCNGNSDKCLDGSGACVECRHNTMGQHCERCPDGYIGDATRGVPRFCQPCPCPLPFSSNNFAIACIRKSGAVRCVCKENYAGTSCERCAPGYYGNPLLTGSTCRKCDCSGNSDPNLIFEDCDEVTGQCRNCLHNTTGFKCERCAPGYYGDARVSKNCTVCRCAMCGTEACDGISGRCHCKAGVTGPLCSRCEVGYYGYDSCAGCQKCACGLASHDGSCDPVTQQCRCRLGAGGLKCEHCQPGFWNYGPYGCQRCNCEGGPCDSRSGACVAEDLDSPAGTHCTLITCDKCIWDLIDDLRLSGVSLEESRLSLLSVSTGVAAHRRLNDVNATISLLLMKLTEKQHHLAQSRLEIANAETKVSSVRAEVDTVQQKGDELSSQGLQVQRRTLENLERAKDTTRLVDDVWDSIQETLDKLQYYETLEEVSPGDILPKLAQAQQILEEMKALELTYQGKLAQEEADQAQELLLRVSEDFQLVQNETLAFFPLIQEEFDKLSAKLRDLQDALEQALTRIEETQEKNLENAGILEEMEIQQENLEEELETFNETLLMAQATVMDLHLAIDEINYVIKNGSELYAEIDGAKKELQESQVNMSQYDDELVRRAAEHAKELQRQVEELQRILESKDTNGLVMKALNASNVHENIVKFVEEANETSGEALSTAYRVSDAVEGINTQISYHQERSDQLLQDAIYLQKTLNGSEDLGVNETHQWLTTVLLRKNSLQDQLKSAMKKLRMIDQGGTGGRMEQVKLMAEEALNTTTMITEVTDPMSQNINSWKDSLKSPEYDKSAYNRVLSTAGDAVRNLTEVVPRLLSKLHTVEMKQPAANVSASIQRIREMIAQTRSVASKVQVSMTFEGQSAVEVNPKIDLSELKAFSSMSLFMKLPPKDPGQGKDRFIMYLGSRKAGGDYMGLAIKADNLVYVYNLGSEHVEIPLDSKPVSSWPAYFSLVKIERVGRHGKVLLTVPSPSSTAEEKFIKKGEVPGNDSLLDLDPEDSVFYVGGVPEDFQLPASLNLPGFQGCLELATLNDDVISLYNFRDIYNIDTVTVPPCARNKLVFTQSRAVSYFFDGSGYGAVKNLERRGRFSQVTRFDVEVRTPAENALVFLMVNGSKFFSLEIQDGFLRLLYDFGFSKGPVLLEDSLKKALISDARSHEVSVIYHNFKKMILVVDRRHVKTVENDKMSMPFSDIYIGGAPSELLYSVRSHLAVNVNFKGCMKSFQFQKKDFNLLEEPGSLGISYGCLEESLMSRRAFFNGESFIASSQKLSLSNAFEVGFSFRSLVPTGLLLYHAEKDENFTIALEEGSVVLSVTGTRVQSTGRHYNDGHNHFVVTSVAPTGYELLVDEERKTSPAREHLNPTPMNAMKFYFGGALAGVPYTNFTGCISNAYFTRMDRDVDVEDFQRYTEKVQANLDGCPVEPPPLALLDKDGQKISKAKGRLNKGRRKDQESAAPLLTTGYRSEQRKMKSHTDPACYLPSKPKATENAWQYGGIANSRQEYPHIPANFTERAHLSLSLRTHLSSGMIFYVSDKEEENFLTLFLAQGKLNFVFNVGPKKLKIKSQEKYSDGLWHNVIFTRERNKGRLIIDGLRMQEKIFPISAFPWHIQGPLYLGGVAPGKASKHIQSTSMDSFTGCLSRLHVNEQVIPAASRTFSVTPCFEGPTEVGTYFSAEGGYVVLDESITLGQKLELEVRPRSRSGVLVHAHSMNGEYLSVYMREGQIIIHANIANGEFSTSVTPKQSLCDGQWHRITVIRDSNVVQLGVDSEMSHVVGPTSSMNLTEPLFVGSVPESLLSANFKAPGIFIGCMRSLMIDHRVVSFSRAALVSGAVSIASCPAA
ncbi:laminin subunit alpha-4 isoform X2 [Rhinatrema bivittatum]|uniref:laminin subunit alpha-4 isoform X2 n=1 Tax=Rhinatrema bivittatum TaxID=194408 RepID=UPI001125E78E|nr:laminin subunit alpha-4 isoform X2 [Rhinatrema bivittatum]